MSYHKSKYAFTGSFIASLLAGHAQAQDPDFWSDTEPAETASRTSEGGADNTDFWSDTTTSTSSNTGDFWSSSSADEVARQRKVVLAQREAQRLRREAERERERQRVELARIDREKREAELAYERARQRQGSGSGPSMGGWGKIAKAVQGAAGALQSGIRDLERQNAQAEAARNQRLAELERANERALAASRRAERRARAAEEQARLAERRAANARVRQNSSSAITPSVTARRPSANSSAASSRSATSEGLARSSPSTGSVASGGSTLSASADKGPRYRYVDRTISPVENRNTYGDDSTARGMLETRVYNAASADCHQLDDGFGIGWVEEKTITYRHWTGGRRPNGTGREDPSRFWWRAESIRFTCRVPQR